MADYSKDDLDKTGASTAKIHKIRITLTSRNVKPLEKCTSSCHIPEVSKLNEIKSALISSTEPRTETSESKVPFVSLPRSSSTPPERRELALFFEESKLTML